jgi:negative modulator of initiation of replication
MKTIEVEDDLYHFIASNTQHIGESASDILRRLVMPGTSSASVSGPLTEPGNAQQNMVDRAQSHCDAQGVFADLAQQDLSLVLKMVDRWLLILSVIHRHNVSVFPKVLAITGRNRRYFATDEQTLLTTGSSTNPKNIPDSDYWVITNNNTAKKINMLKAVGQAIGFDGPQIERLVALFSLEQN